MSKQVQPMWSRRGRLGLADSCKPWARAKVSLGCRSAGIQMHGCKDSSTRYCTRCRNSSRRYEVCMIGMQVRAAGVAQALGLTIRLRLMIQRLTTLDGCFGELTPLVRIEHATTGELHCNVKEQFTGVDHPQRTAKWDGRRRRRDCFHPSDGSG